LETCFAKILDPSSCDRIIVAVTATKDIEGAMISDLSERIVRCWSLDSILEKATRRCPKYQSAATAATAAVWRAENH
jgi:hypothetical protein